MCSRYISILYCCRFSISILKGNSLSIIGIYPPLCPVQKHRNLPVDLNQYGSVNGDKVLTKIILDKFEKTAPGTRKRGTIYINKRIDVFKDDRRVFRLDEQLLEPKSKKFIVKNYSDSQWSVKLKLPSAELRKKNNYKLKRKFPGAQSDEDTPYEKKKASENPFLAPQKISERLLRLHDSAAHF